MEKFFNPSSIVIYGVSSTPGNLAAIIIENLQEMGFRGKIYGVGAQNCEVKGCPVYTSIKEIPDQIDMVTVMTPARTVPDIFKQCGELGIKRIVLMTAGFNELGGEGLQLAEEIMAIAREFNIKFIGPNCQGLIDFYTGVCLPFGNIKRHLIRKGRISIVAQSGSVGWVLSQILSHELGGVSKVISVGNKLSIDEVQAVEYLMSDDRTDIILLYLESFSDGKKLFELARQSEKPIIVLKANRGSKSDLAISHTAALASNDRVVEAAFKQAGIIRAETFRDFIDWAKALSGHPMRGTNVVSIAASGGMALLSEDACRKSGLNLIALPDDIKDKLWEIGRPQIIKHTNPIDTGNIFDNTKVLDIVKMVLALDQVDGIVFCMFNLGKEFHGEMNVQEALSQTFQEADRAGKPIAIFIITDPEANFNFKHNATFPLYDSIEDAVESLSKKWHYTVLRSRIKQSPFKEYICSDIERAKQIISSITDYCLDDIESMELLQCYGINSIQLKSADSPEGISRAAQETGYPVAMKIHSRSIIHKSDVGGIRLNIKNDREALQCFAEIMKAVKKSVPDALISGVKIQKMVQEGIEVIVGGKKDKDFGQVVMVGLGGIYTEILDDVVFRIAPLTKEECLEMLQKLKGYRIFTGIRGKEPSDLDSLADILARFSKLLVDFPQISEADLNPVRVLPKGSGAFVLDARMFLEKTRLKTGLSKNNKQFNAW